MTHKYKKPGAHVTVHSSAEQTESPQNQKSFLDQMMGRLRSTADVVQQNFMNHYGLWTGIGLVFGAAVYLLATEHGRNVTSQIRDATIDIVNRAISPEETGEFASDIPELRRAS
jgi:hypothetical protein